MKTLEEIADAAFKKVAKANEVTREDKSESWETALYWALGVDLDYGVVRHVVLEALEADRMQQSIEILHSRDPDSSCDHTVFVNGEATTAYSMEDIDPGAGYEREEWEERFELPDFYTPAFRAATLEALSEASDSEYIEDHREYDLLDPDERED